MAYQKQTFINEETVLTAEMLDHIEKGIIKNENDIKQKADLDQNNEQITEAVNTALAQAKESGDFKGDTGATGPQGPKGDTGAKGVDGYTPIKGTDYFTEEDKAEIAQAVIESFGGNPIFGYVDENNNIVVQGNLADGSYSVKYEMEDGTVLDIGDLVLEAEPTYTNLFDPSAAVLNQRINSSGTTTALDGHIITAFIDVSEKTPFTNDTKLYVKGATFNSVSSTEIRAKIYAYKTKPTTGYGGDFSNINNTSMTITNEGGGVISVSNIASTMASGVEYMVLVLNVKNSAVTYDDIKDIVVTIDEPIN